MSHLGQLNLIVSEMTSRRQLIVLDRIVSVIHVRVPQSVVTMRQQLEDRRIVYPS